MKKILPLILFLLCVWISARFAAGYWVTGPVFGVTVLAVNWGRISKKISFRHLLFVVLSTLLYALVYALADKGWKFRQDWLDMLAGSLTAGVILGSVLMPSLHALLFGPDLKTVRAVSVSLIVTWYIILFISWLDELTGLKPDVDYLFISIALWQGIYLSRLKLN